MMLIEKRRSNCRSSTVSFGAEAVVMNVRYWPKAGIHDDLFLVEINNEYFACQFIFCTDA